MCIFVQQITTAFIFDNSHKIKQNTFSLLNKVMINGSEEWASVQVFRLVWNRCLRAQLALWSVDCGNSGSWKKGREMEMGRETERWSASIPIYIYFNEQAQGELDFISFWHLVILVFTWRQCRQETAKPECSKLPLQLNIEWESRG